ncbi:cysteine protease StiP domain-containing protein [Clostridium mediterraneense]|uniref:cysteine protease StiP domain-containing protein n=1 Tax=Clostridium mediterraneense TaxID=1805472 RepID=UPI000835ECA0|nr:cysteine protease StiP domain-containing protein [Clostridium mediterraneense]
MKLINGSYKDDCTFLLKDISDTVSEVSVEEKEKIIRSGISYSETISKEDKPTKAREKDFFKMLETHGQKIADYVAKISEAIYKEKGNDLIIVSLARAGTPYGILMKKYLRYKYGVETKHYSISIIRGKGVDYNALKYILKNHPKAKIQFVDAWTGKGSIIRELEKSIEIFNRENNQNVDNSLAVIADPAKLSKFYGTREDIAIPTSILNSTVSGLVSRTILSDKYIKDNEFHGAKMIDYLKEYDYSQLYIDRISSLFRKNLENFKFEKEDRDYAKDVTIKIKDIYNVDDINLIKLSVGEASRVLIRRKAKMLLLKDISDQSVRQLVNIAREKKLEIREYKDSDYKAIAIIEGKDK